LLRSGADPSQRDNLGFSPLAEACKLGHDELIDILVKAGATLTDQKCATEVRTGRRFFKYMQHFACV
jgi:hypothetical protein